MINCRLPRVKATQNLSQNNLRSEYECERTHFVTDLKLLAFITRKSAFHTFIDFTKCYCKAHSRLNILRFFSGTKGYDMSQKVTILYLETLCCPLIFGPSKWMHSVFQF